MSRQETPGQSDDPMTEDQIERVAGMLYELDRQKGLRSHRWNVGSEAERERYRAKARELLSGEDFTRLVAQLEHQYRWTGRLIYEGFEPIPVPGVL